MSKWSENLAEAKEYALIGIEADKAGEFEMSCEAWESAVELALGFDERDEYWLKLLAAEKKLRDSEGAKRALVWKGC